jgi:hydroxymethylpyrimidine kinase / phosphomethylpyrimidine kinase / thiamine-phosphate diphosphorylase
MKVALSIAGSDSGAGAGIQADLKTFSALGIYGCTAITAITAQNTRGVSAIYEIKPEIIAEQIRSILIDIPIDAIKIGMVYNKQIIQTVGKMISNSKCPVILDPIILAGSGARLLLNNAIESFIDELVPLSTLVTPNITEAEKLTNTKIESEDDVIEAAHAIRKLGARNVIIKGGHFGMKKSVTDFFLDNDGKSAQFSNPWIDVQETHGSGCNFSAAAAAFASKGFSLVNSCRLANQYIHSALKSVLKIGRGLVVADPISGVSQDASRYNILRELQLVVNKIQTVYKFGRLIPETQCNIVFALSDAKSVLDVAGVKGRIVKLEHMARAVSNVEFGASKHVASAVLSYMKFDPTIRSGMNIKYDDQILSICKSIFQISEYDRTTEPANIKKKEGKTINWGIMNALLKNRNAQAIYHKGDVGKEPMIILFGRDPNEVFEKIKRILGCL